MLPEVLVPHAGPFSGQWAASEPNLSNNCPYLGYPPSPPTFVLWQTDYYSLDYLSCGWDWAWWLFIWPGLGSLKKKKKNRGLHENEHFIFSLLCRTQSSSHMVTIQWWITANSTPSAVRNQITPWWSSAFRNVNSNLSLHALPLQLDGTVHKSLCFFPLMLPSTQETPIA